MMDRQYTIERIARVLNDRRAPFIRKSMMGGEAFMVDDKMCVGIFRDALMVRIDPIEEENLAGKPGAERMTMAGKTMKGYLLIAPEGFDTNSDLEFWVDKCLAFNPKAKASKKRK
ncbi:MAG TPA: TfoX/Sxy family protein [Flavilitoribacter sp.]|nr:TfoX/Sxy family protein [Flavilitoribacter sp.]